MSKHEFPTPYDIEQFEMRARRAREQAMRDMWQGLRRALTNRRGG